MKIDGGLKKVLLEINFLGECKKLSGQYLYSKDSFDNYSNDEVVKIISALGYPLKYNKKENFIALINHLMDGILLSVFAVNTTLSN